MWPSQHCYDNTALYVSAKLLLRATSRSMILTIKTNISCSKYLMGLRKCTVLCQELTMNTKNKIHFNLYYIFRSAFIVVDICRLEINTTFHPLSNVTYQISLKKTI